jgi:hypothetical protein
MKMIPAPFLALLAILFSIGFYFDPSEFFPDGAVGLLMLVAATMLFAWHGGRMKFVSVDSDNLYVSGYRKSTVIPLGDIQFVHYSPGVGLVNIRLRAPSEFGSTFAFMPTWANGLLAFFGQPSIVEELRGLARDAAARSVNAI